MFDPANAKKDKQEKAARRKALATIKSWCLSAIPIDIQEGLIIDVKEIICGDPACAPIDTVVTLVWKDGGRGMFGMPLDPLEVQQEDILDSFPTNDVLTKWSKGEPAEWPPRPQLRFNVDDRVACRIGPHPVTGWAPGRIIKLFYREPNWPPNMMAPYQVMLHDGRLIFAPQDTDNVIKLRPPRAEDDDSPPSPSIEELLMKQEVDYEDDEDER
eukprot:TRINITY_DN99634_c0_g1_i1.p1 TRINITY_DN99634_c0_g1~~TRINITY_DN99634_c0_g1_i1.p1  ORF type:complete len:214 (+),score=5.88 TRINITY_DN99634_c0_g1_i1:26-667(+)